MSTASLAAPRTRLRLSVRGRRVLAALAAAPVVAGLSIAALCGAGAANGSSDPGLSAASFETVTVAPGDSLWSIAVSLAPGEDPRDVIDDIAALNRLPDGVLRAGAELAIPVQYSID